MLKWVTYDLNREHNVIKTKNLIEPTNCPPMSKVHKVLHEHVHFRIGMLPQKKSKARRTFQRLGSICMANNP